VGDDQWWQASAREYPDEHIGEIRASKKEPQPYLCPKEATQTRPITCFKAPSEHANEHDEKQDYVGGERDNDSKFGGHGVGYYAGVCYMQRNTANLWVEVSFGGPKRSKLIIHPYDS
jgi:hypothetical protein